MRKSESYALSWTLFWAVGMAVLVFLSVQFAEDRLIYSLDDPYIHLAVAENILIGGYGINSEEFSSPSSSILYPILLTPAVALRIGTLGPLIINALAAGLSVWLLLEFFYRRTILETANQWPIFTNTLAPFLILSISAFALPMTGMEHSLHVLAVIVTMRGIVTVVEGGKVSVWLALAVICMPLLRFEGLALAGAAILVLILVGHWRAAGLIGAAITACFVANFVFMYSIGLPLIPSSVLVKFDVAAHLLDGRWQDALMELARNSITSMRFALNIILAATVCALLATTLVRVTRERSLKSPEVLFAGCMVLGLGAHLVAGSYGWFHRYEVYAVAMLVTGSAYFLGPILQRFTGVRLIATQVSLIIILAILDVAYVEATIKTPMASRNIYEQQFQMHRFATEFFPRRVAVNDLGWVSYQNDAFVLDLWGLGSETVRKLRAAERLDALAIEGLAENADIDFAMIYNHVLKDSIPESWCLMAVMQTEQVTAGSEEVYFYATKASNEADMRAALTRFSPTLPDRVSLEPESCARQSLQL